jgi:hypothetical protein
MVLDHMCEHKLYLRPGKCKFEKTRIEYLIVIISHNKVEMDPVKIAGVADWPMPSNKKKDAIIQWLHQLLLMIHPWVLSPWHAHFDLTMKDIRFIWGFPQEDCFMKLKEFITLLIVSTSRHFCLFGFPLNAPDTGGG